MVYIERERERELLRGVQCILECNVRWYSVVGRNIYEHQCLWCDWCATFWVEIEKERKLCIVNMCGHAAASAVLYLDTPHEIKCADVIIDGE